MAYNVKNSAGNTLVVIPDRHIDRETTSLALLGFNVTRYGVDHAENFVHLLENFANDIAPENPLPGQMWWDTGSGTMKVYHDAKWSALLGSPTVGTDPTVGGIAGIFHCALSTTSIALIFAGGRVVAIIANKDLAQSELPETVSVAGLDYAVRSFFPLGVQGGMTLADSNDATNPSDYVFSGRVPLSEQAHFAGGGVDDAEVSGWGYVDIGPGKSVGLMVSCGQIIGAVASGFVLASELPNTITFYVKKEIDTGGQLTNNATGEYQTLDANYNAVTCQLKSRFPAQDYKKWVVGADGLPTFDPAQTIRNVALFPGMTFASAVNTVGGIGQTFYSLISAVQASQTTQLGTAIASVSTELKAWVDNSSATALKVTNIEAAFTTATGTTTVASAVQSIIAQATDTSATTSAITSLKSDFTNALGTTTFASALSKISTSANASSANSQAITEIKSSFTDKFGGSSFAEAINNLYTKTDAQGNTVSGWGLTLNTNGYVTGIQAINGGSTNNSFKVTTSNFVIGDNNIDFIPFQVKNGVVYMKNAAIENLTIGADKITPGVSNAFKFEAPDVYVGARYTETTIIETPFFSIGDAFGGRAVAFIAFMQDGRYSVDSGQTLRVYSDNGSGYQLVRLHTQQGFRVKGGDVTYAIPVMFPITLTGTQQCRIKVTGEMVKMPGQTDYNASYCRNVEVHVFQTAR